MKVLDILQILFMIMAIMMTYKNVYERFYTSKTTTTHTTEHISEIGIPNHLSIVFTPSFNTSILKLYGYQTAFHFFNGLLKDPQKADDGLFFGGHNSTVTSRQFLDIFFFTSYL